MLNARVGECCGVMGLEKRTDESVLCWFGHIEIKENSRIAKRIYEGKTWMWSSQRE